MLPQACSIEPSFGYCALLHRDLRFPGVRCNATDAHLPREADLIKPSLFIPTEHKTGAIRGHHVLPWYKMSEMTEASDGDI